jgi:hypothetical protein
MADNKDELEARRWFRLRLDELAQQYPHLTSPASQERLSTELDRQAQENTPCHENPQADHEEGQ